MGVPLSAPFKTRLKTRIKSFLIRHDLWDEPIDDVPPVAHEAIANEAVEEEEDWHAQVEQAVQQLNEGVDIDTLIAELDEDPWEDPPAPVEAAPEPESKAEPTSAPAGDNEMTMEAVQEIFDEMVRPALQMDGGDISLVRIENNDIYVRLVGACQSCPSSVMTMKMGIERMLAEEFPQLGQLIQVDDPFADFTL